MQPAHVVVDMQVSAGQTAELYLNDLTREPLRQPVMPGQRHRYRFGEVYESLRLFRLDPTEAPGATVDIYGITVADEQGVIQTFDAATIVAWGVLNIEPPRLVDGAARFVPTSNDPIIQTGVDVPIRSVAPAGLAVLGRRTQQPRFAADLLWLFVLALVLAVMADPTRRLHAPLSLAAVAVTVLGVRAVVAGYEGLAPIGQAVGRAGYLGRSTPAIQLGTLAALGGAVALAVGAWWAQRWLPPRAEPSGEGDPAARPGASVDMAPLWRRLLEPGLVLLALSLALFPDLPSALHAATTREYHPDWDGNAVLIWSYLAHQGQLPLRDFWFPYGGHHLFYGRLPDAILYRWLYEVATYFGLFYTVYCLSRFRLLPALLVVLAVMIGAATPLQAGVGIPVFWGATRHLLSAVIALAYLTIDPRRERYQAGHALFGGYCCLGLLIEPVQVAFAGPAVAAKLGLDLVQTWPSSWRQVGRRLLREFAVPAVFLAGYLLVITARGALPGFLEFYLGLGAAGHSSAEPADLAGALTRPVGVDFVVIVLPLAFVALGLFERLRRPLPANPHADWLLALGLVGFVFLQKHLVRSMPWQVFLMPALGAFGYAVLWQGRRYLAERLVMAVTAGVFAALLIIGGGAAQPFRALTDGPARLAAGLNLLLNETGRIAAANEAAYAPARFVRYAAENQVVAFLRGRHAAGQVPTVYVLGDSQAFYILLRQTPPYHTNNYNASPIREQRKVVGWLRRERPAYVIWDPSRSAFDLVPFIIRNPLIYDEVIVNYLPLEVVGGYHVLRSRNEGERVPVDYWRETLGPMAHFGYLASVSSFAKFGACRVGPCVEFLQVELTEPVARGEEVAVPVEVAGRAFTVLFNTVAGQSTYHVLLDRVWFWGALRRAGYSPRLVAEALPPRAKATILSLAPEPDILY
jgi:hypothetical protein